MGTPIRTVQIGAATLGEGPAALIVPLTSATPAALLEEAARAAARAPDIVEWRLDHLEPVPGEPPLALAARIVDIAPQLRGRIGDAGLLLTFRTAAEGGKRAIGDAEYADLLVALARSEVCDAIDVEAYRPRVIVERIVAAARGAGCPVIASNHDFAATPPSDEIVRRLRFMQDEVGADVQKIAVMPRDAGDVLALMAATWQMASTHARTPLITMSMGGPGLITRLGGEAYGSAATFGAVGEASAPGQIDAGVLAGITSLIHEALRA